MIAAPLPRCTPTQSLIVQLRARGANNYKPAQRMRCLECGGDMSLTDAVMYLRGYIAAGGNAHDVFPDWKE